MGLKGPLSLLTVDNLTHSDAGMQFTAYSPDYAAGINFPTCNSLTNVHNSELWKRYFYKSAQRISSSLKTGSKSPTPSALPEVNAK